MLCTSICISAGKMLFSLPIVCKTCSLQSYKYSFNSNRSIVANTQSDVPFLKALRREQTFFIFSSSLQGSLAKMRSHHNNNKAPVVFPNTCGQFNTAKSVAQASPRNASSKAEITFQWYEQTGLQLWQSSHHLGLDEARKYSLEHKLFPLATKATASPRPYAVVDVRYHLNKTNIWIIAENREWNWYLCANPYPLRSGGSGFSETLSLKIDRKTRR